MVLLRRGRPGALAPEYALCASGRNQSPVDLDTALAAELLALETNYRALGRELVNNGHTLKLAYPEGNVLRVDGATFALKQVHFHAPSEHTVDGRRYPMEAHLVHANAAGELAVVAVLFERGEAHVERRLRGGEYRAESQRGDRRSLQPSLRNRAGLPGNEAFAAGQSFDPVQPGPGDGPSGVLGYFAGLEPDPLPDGAYGL